MSKMLLIDPRIILKGSGCQKVREQYANSLPTVSSLSNTEQEGVSHGWNEINGT